MIGALEHFVTSDSGLLVERENPQTPDCILSNIMVQPSQVNITVLDSIQQKLAHKPTQLIMLKSYWMESNIISCCVLPRSNSLDKIQRKEDKVEHTRNFTLIHGSFVMSTRLVSDSLDEIQSSRRPEEGPLGRIQRKQKKVVPKANFRLPIGTTFLMI